MEEENENDITQTNTFKKIKYDDGNESSSSSQSNNIITTNNNGNNINNTNNSIININNVHTNSNRFSDTHEMLLQDKSRVEQDLKNGNDIILDHHYYDLMRISHSRVHRYVSSYVVNWEIIKVIFIGKIKDKNSAFSTVPFDILKLIIKYYRHNNRISHHVFPRVNPNPEIPNDVYNEGLKAAYNKIIYDSDVNTRERIIDRYLVENNLSYENHHHHGSREPIVYLNRILDNINKILKLLK